MKITRPRRFQKGSLSTGAVYANPPRIDNAQQSFIDALCIVRNNIRHGQKEYTPRSGAIIENFNDCLDRIVSHLQRMPQEKIRNQVIAANVASNERATKIKAGFSGFAVISFWAFVSLLVVGALFGGSSSSPSTHVDCSLQQNKHLCDQLELDEYEQSQDSARYDQFINSYGRN